MGRRCRAEAAGSARPEWGAGAEQRLPGARGGAEVAARPVRPYTDLNVAVLLRPVSPQALAADLRLLCVPRPGGSLQLLYGVRESIFTQLPNSIPHLLCPRSRGRGKKGLECAGSRCPLFTLCLNVACVPVELSQTRVTLSSESPTVAVLKVAVQVLPSA